MKKKKRGRNFNISNRLAYTLIAFAFIIGLTAVIYAVVPNPGHSLSQLEMPSCTSSGQALTWNGAAWICGTPSGTDSRFTVNSSGLCYNSPAMCGPLISTSCYWFFQIYQHCNEYNSYNTLCLDWCDSHRQSSDCNGDISSACSGGTTTTHATSAYGSCDVMYQDGTGDTILCACYGSNYELENLIPEGIRCL